MTKDLATHLRKQLVRSLVQRAITCPLTGAVLDVRTVAVVNDADGDPAIVLSPEGADVPGDVSCPPEVEALVRDLDHRHRGLGRDPGDPAPDELVEHDVADHEDALSPHRGEEGPRPRARDEPHRARRSRRRA